MMRFVLMSMLVVVLAGCGGATSPAAPGAETAATPGGAALPAGSVEATVAQALAQQAGRNLDVLRLTDKVEQEWSDSSLGCPDPSTMYMQVITPGYKLTFSDGSNTYVVHTDQAGENAVLCENGSPTVLP